MNFSPLEMVTAKTIINHEVTLMLTGNQSKAFIQDFYNSRVGQEIVQATQKLQQNRSKELIKVVESSWQENPKSSSKSNNFEIFSGRNFGKNGFCVRFDKKDYLVDGNEEIIYFRTEKEAQKVANEFKQESVYIKIDKKVLW